MWFVINLLNYEQTSQSIFKWNASCRLTTDISELNLIGPQVNINQFQYLGKQMLVGFKYRQIIPSLLNNLSAVQLHTLVFPKT